MTTRRRRSLFAACALALSATSLAAPSAATVLSFDWTRDPVTGNVAGTVSPSELPSDYGDFVTGASVAVPGGAFLYGEAGEGFTPNVAVDIRAGFATPTDPRVELWALGFGDLENVVYGLPGSSFMEVVLTADPGVEVVLYGFDLGGYPGSDWVINAVHVLSPTATLFTQTSVLVEGGGGAVRHTTFSFATPLVASELVIRIDYANLTTGRQDNVGLDNLRFGQNPAAVPEPALGWLFGAGTLALAARAMNRNSPPRMT
jgi:hypothetical protein